MTRIQLSPHDKRLLLRLLAHATPLMTPNLTIHDINRTYRTLRRLSNFGLIEINNGTYQLTKRGHDRAKALLTQIKSFINTWSPFLKSLGLEAPT